MANGKVISFKEYVTKKLNESGYSGGMLNGALPGAVSPNILGDVQANTRYGKGGDTKAENRRNAPKMKALNNFIRFCARAEEEEGIADYDRDVYDKVCDAIDDGHNTPKKLAYRLNISPEEAASWLKVFNDEEIFAGAEGEEDSDYNFGDDIDLDFDYDKDRDDDNKLDIDPDLEDELDIDIDDDGDCDGEEDDIFGDLDDENLDDEDLDDKYDEYGDDDEYVDYELDDDEFEDEEEHSVELDYDKDDLDPEDEDDDYEELDFEKNYYDSDEFDDEDSYDDMAASMMDRSGSISDDVVDDIDDQFGTLSKWWREQLVKPPKDLEIDDVDVEDDYDDEDDLDVEDDYDGEEVEDLDREDGFDRKPRFRDFHRSHEEEQEVGQPTMGAPEGQPATAAPGPAPAGPTKKDQARAIFPQLVQQEMSRAEIINAFVEQLGVTQSTAVSYYEAIAKEFGMTNADHTQGRGIGGPGSFEDPNTMPATHPHEEPMLNQPPEEDVDGFTSDDPNKQGIIRVVNNAHLVYKRQQEDGSYREMWVYNIGKGIKDELKVRRKILSGTDIPQGKTRSQDGSQHYELATMGNAQVLTISGLPQ